MFRLDEDERKILLARNEKYTKPLSGEIEILDKLDFDAPEKDWIWKSATEVSDMLGIYGRNGSAVQVGKVLAKMSRTDNRVQINASHNKKKYLVPPLIGYNRGVLEFDEDGALSA